VRRRSFCRLAPEAAMAAIAGIGRPFAAAPDVGAGRGWLILDFDAVFCGLCFEPVLALLRSLPTAVQEGALTAVLVHSPGGAGGSGRPRRRLVEAKWDGLCRVHGWMLPAVLDSGGLTRTLLGSRTARLLLFDVRSRDIAAWDLPLSAETLDRVLAVLLK
jgi:hypothetical protein